MFDASKAKKVESLAIFYSGSAKVIVKTTQHNSRLMTLRFAKFLNYFLIDHTSCLSGFDEQLSNSPN